MDYCNSDIIRKTTLNICEPMLVNFWSYLTCTIGIAIGEAFLSICIFITIIKIINKGIISYYSKISHNDIEAVLVHDIKDGVQLQL